MKLETLCSAMEAILFAAGEPLEGNRIAEALEIPPESVRQLADLIAKRYEKASGLQLLRLDDTYQITTKPEHAEVIRRVLEVKRNAPLSNAAMEVLTIIAYNQPVTKGFVERVRGVDSSTVVNTLVERGLLEEAGRIEVPGRPLTYRTTAQFLRCFGISSLAELPPLPNSDTPSLFDLSPEDIPAPASAEEQPEDDTEADPTETIEAESETDSE